MNKKNFIVFLLILIIISLFFVSQYLTGAQALKKEEIIKITEFSTDKEVYYSREKIISSLEIESLKSINNVSFILEGIKPYNTAYLKDSKVVDLKKGENKITFEGISPYCTSGCGGVYPGDYDVNIKVFIEGDMIANLSTTIKLTN